MTMYADSVFQNQGDQIRIRKKDLISVSVYPLHAEYSQRSVRLPGPPGAVIRRLLDWAARMGIKPPEGSPRAAPHLSAAGRKYHCPLRWSWHKCRCHLHFWIFIAFVAPPEGPGSWRAGHRMLAVRTKVPDEGYSVVNVHSVQY